ncbi:MAG TPA: MFS transporter [Myxococcaceae bacterium]|nr:MFS transporter [Myxococcaceae bacterium]
MPALTLLTLINLFNYLDRYVVAGVLPRIEAEFGLGHAQAGALGTVFMAVYMLASPLGGYLGDRLPRRWVVAVSVFLWSVATLASGWAGGFTALLLARALIGVGEAGYGTVAPALLSDLYPAGRRTMVLSVFYAAMPVGAAAGYAVGGFFSQAGFWRGAFFSAGAPGLLLAALALALPEPGRGANEGAPAAAPALALRVGLRELRRNTAFWVNTAGQTLMTFSIGGLAFWMPTFLERERGLPADKAGFIFGAITAAAGITGTLTGGWLGAKADRRSNLAGLRLSGGAFLAAAPFMVTAGLFRQPTFIFASVFIAQFLVFVSSGPLNAALMTAVSPRLRAFAMGLSILVLHLLGDAISPPLIGTLAQATSFSAAIQANAVPLACGGLVLLLIMRRPGLTADHQTESGA